MSRLRLATAAIFILIALVAVVVHALQPKLVTVWLDNGTDEPVTVVSDDGARAEVARHDYRQFELPTGLHKLTARDLGGRVVDEQGIMAARRSWFTGGSYIWNIGGRNRYGVYTMTYGKDVDAPPVAIGVGERLFAIPKGVGPEFMGAMPATVTVARGTATAVEKRVYHLPLHEDRPCCAAIVKMVREQQTGSK